MGSIAGTVLIKALNKNSKPVDALIGVAMIAPTAVDGAAEYFCGKESNNKRRLITGLIAGFGCAITETSKGSGIYAVYSCDILYIECRQEGRNA